MAKRRSKRWKVLKPKEPILNLRENVKRSTRKPDGIWFDEFSEVTPEMWDRLNAHVHD